MKLPLSTRIVRRTLRGLPAPRFRVSYEPGLRIPMADGVELLADHYFPDSGAVQDFPSLLVRSPHGRGLRCAALYGMAFAEQGFHVLLQSARGTSGSGGIFQPWRDDGPDGQATIVWLRRQAWFDGRLGLVGPGAFAYEHRALAADPPPEVKAVVVLGAAAHPDRDPDYDSDAADGYRQGPNLLRTADAPAVPTLVISGWNDMALDQALQQYGRLPAGRRSLLIGPWTRGSALRRGAGRVFTESLAWLRGHLVGPAPPKEYVRVAVSGTGTGPPEWRDLSAWPPAAVPTSWYLRPDGSRSGVRNNKPLERSDDALIFTSPPLTEAIEVIGVVAADLLVKPWAGPPSTTVRVRLCDVDERGRSRSVCDGITRVTGPPPATITVPMSSTAHRFQPGHRLRVRISVCVSPHLGADRVAFRFEVRPGSVIVLPLA